MFTNAGTSSFTQFLAIAAPELLPGRRPLPPGLSADVAPHATTIVTGQRLPIMGAPTLNVGTIEGGSGVNLVPDAAEIGTELWTT